MNTTYTHDFYIIDVNNDETLTPEQRATLKRDWRNCRQYERLWERRERRQARRNKAARYNFEIAFEA